ncbi:MAG: methyltransferase [Ginsengibacter sp.]
MSNSYFQFKQFKIEQEKSSMKVCTDSCLFGAWVAHKIEKKIINPSSVLDIGAGTGLLSLMLAQKSNAIIHAVEIEENSFEQAKENFASSPWHQRMRAFHQDIKEWENKLKYDLIISNPPFYENDLKSNHANKNLAKHHDGLTLKELIQSIKNNMSGNGNFATLLPYHRVAGFADAAMENGFYVQEELLVKQNPKHSFFRGILLFGKKEKSKIHYELTIKNEQGKYTNEFQELLKDYYLKQM